MLLPSRVYTPPSFLPGSGNTPIAVWGTNLNLIQNPQIRAKHGGKEHINVSPGLQGSWGLSTQHVTSLKAVGLPACQKDPPQVLMTRFV